ncbi:MAG TPA: hypothetical protein VLY87_01405 [Flavobacterium sp.]|nr:hypothetical protein [Flavobacterium sp.]
MKKRSSKAVQLILITSVLASCNKPVAKTENENKQRVYMRADSTAQYTDVTNQYQQRSHSSGMGNTLLWYMAFRHLGGGMGYASSGLNSQSVVGKNSAKANAYNKATTRGGFGSSARNSNVSASS